MTHAIQIFDTTLRDGEQAPGCSMDIHEKVEVAKQLERLKVDVIEAGFAISSDGDFEAVRTIAQTVKDCTVASLARAVQKDIDRAYEALRFAADPLIHTFISTSPLHMEYKLKMQPDQVFSKGGGHGQVRQIQVLQGGVFRRGRYAQRSGVFSPDI